LPSSLIISAVVFYIIKYDCVWKRRRGQTAEMDVDGDVDSQLLQQFSSMATTDREVLIAEFQRLLGNQLSDAGCAFFLDMNNWQGILLFLGID